MWRRIVDEIEGFGVDRQLHVHMHIYDEMKSHEGWRAINRAMSAWLALPKSPEFSSTEQWGRLSTTVTMVATSLRIEHSRNGTVRA